MADKLQKTPRKKKKRRVRLFYPIYFTLIAAAAIAVWLGCGKLSLFLADYEQSNPKYAAEEAFAIFERRDAETFYDFADKSLFPNETREMYVAWMNSLTEGASFDYVMAYSDREDVKKYTVKMNGQKFGSFSLIEQPDATEYGFSTWAFYSLETPDPTPVTYTVTAPSTASVMAGDQMLTAENVAQAAIKTEWDGHMLLEETAAPTLTAYSFTRCFGCPDITVTDASGQICALSGSEEDGFTALRNSDTALQAETEARATDIIKAYSAFTSNDLSTYQMLKYVRKGTTAYSVISSFDNQWFGKHSSAKVEDLTIDNYIRFTDDTMACDAHYNYVVEYNDGVKSYETNYRFYLVLRDGVWYLYDFSAV